MPKQVTIIGAGFAALTAVRTLSALKADVDITLIAPKAEFIYLPSLIWIPNGMRTEDDLTIDLKPFFAKHNVKYHPGRVESISEDSRTVHTDNGDINNDALFIGSGGRFIRKLPGIENTITICEGIPAAVKYRDALKNMDGGTIALGFSGNPKEPSAMRGGPMFELLFGLDTQLRKENRREKFNIVFFSPAPQPGKRMGEKAVGRLLEEMNKRDINVHKGHKLKGFESNKIMTEGGDIDADLILFMPGMTGPSWAADSHMPLSEGGMIQADEHCHVIDKDFVYIAGDSGSFPGPAWKPKQAHMADLQAAAAIKNMMTELNGGTGTESFKTELTCIVDSIDSAILVYRSDKRSIQLPGKPFHYAKRFFEWWYLRPYRNP